MHIHISALGATVVYKNIHNLNSSEKKRVQFECSYGAGGNKFVQARLNYHM